MPNLCTAITTMENTTHFVYTHLFDLNATEQVTYGAIPNCTSRRIARRPSYARWISEFTLSLVQTQQSDLELSGVLFARDELKRDKFVPTHKRAMLVIKRHYSYLRQSSRANVPPWAR